MNLKVILFGAEEWCHSCRIMKPIFKEVSKIEDFKDVDFQDIDVESEEGVDLSSQYSVRNVPTILFIKGNEVVKRIVGTQTKEELSKDIINFCK